MFIFLNPFRILFNSNGFGVPIEFKKFLLALKIKQSFILFIYFHITRFGKSWDVTGVCSGILMFNPLITKEIIQGVVLEHGAVVTSYNQHENIVLSLNQVDEVDKSP